MEYAIWIYLAIGFILTMVWWFMQYKEEYDHLKKTDGVEDGMACIYLMILVVFWPVKLIKDVLCG